MERITETIDLRQSDDPRDVVHRICHALADGELIALPTETQYTVIGSALQSSISERLKRACPGEGVELVVRCADEARDYWLEPPGVVDKLSRRCWPGPVVLEVDQKWLGGLFYRLPTPVQNLLLGENGAVRFRVPASPIWGEIQRLTPAPFVSLSDAATVSRRTTDLLSATALDEVALVVDDGPCRYGENSTVVRINALGWTVASAGVVSQRNIARLASDVYLFVCTGNTCRSPMAEALFRKLLAERLQCRPDELVDHGFVVASAGLAAPMGAPANPEAVDLLAADGIDLREHESQPLTDRLLTQADHIFTMTRHHRQAILAERPDLQDRVHLLSPDGEDISDPIGAGAAVYSACRDEIQRYLQHVIEQLVIEVKPQL